MVQAHGTIVYTYVSPFAYSYMNRNLWCGGVVVWWGSGVMGWWGGGVGHQQVAAEPDGLSQWPNRLPEQGRKTNIYV